MHKENNAAGRVGCIRESVKVKPKCRGEEEEAVCRSVSGQLESDENFAGGAAEEQRSGVSQTAAGRSGDGWRADSVTGAPS